MTYKFKVGDRVTLSGVVVGVGVDGSKDSGHWPYEVQIDGEDIVDRFSERSLRNTTFRDQAAIAALQGMLINTDVSPGGDARAMAKSSFELAEALDAERKKRDLVDKENSKAISLLDELTEVGERHGYKDPRGWAKTILDARKKLDGV